MEPIEHELKQGTEEWLEFRKRKIGASDAPVIMGVAPKRWGKTPYKLWQLKLGRCDEQPMSYAMQRGHQLEPKARKDIELMHGCSLEPAVLEHPEHSWMVASMDGYNRRKGIGLEIKWVSKVDTDLARLGQVPDHYYPQLQHQMAVSGLSKIHYYSCHEEGNVLLEVPRDEEYIEELIRKEQEFLQCVLDQRPPLSEEELDAMSESVSIAAELEEIWSELDPLLEREKEIKAVLAEREIAGTFGGVTVRYVSRPGTIQYKEIPELAGVDLDKYRGPSGGTWQVARARRRSSL